MTLRNGPLVRWFLFCFIALPTIALADSPRDLHMRITFKNPNSYSVPLVVKNANRSGRLECDSDPRTIRWVDAGGSANLKCVAYSERGTALIAPGYARNVTLSWETDPRARRVVPTDGYLQVKESNHDFTCRKGCEITQDWGKCGASGQCSVNIQIRFDHVEYKP
jgi:hypothetical protein